MKVTKLWDEFTKFAFKGNMMQLAVAVVIGNAFGAVVNSLVKNILMPLVDYVMPTHGGTYREWHVGKVEIGSFLSELLNFLIIAAAMFVIVVKFFGAIQHLIPGHGDTPSTKECPYCISSIPARAVRCPQCTSDLAGDRDGHASEPAHAESA